MHLPTAAPPASPGPTCPRPAGDGCAWRRPCVTTAVR